MIRLRTPRREPRLLEDLRQHQHRQGRLLRGLDHHRAARGDRRADLAGPHRQREVPRGDQHAWADRLLQRQHPALAVRRHRVATVDPHRLLGEPAQELGGVHDLRLGLLQRLAHLQCHQQGKLALALDDRVERAAEDLASLTGGCCAQLGPGFDGGVERRLGVIGRRVGDLDERLPGGRVLDRDRSLRAVPPLAGDVQPLGDLLQNLLLVGGGDRAHYQPYPAVSSRHREGDSSSQAKGPASGRLAGPLARVVVSLSMPPR